MAGLLVYLLALTLAADLVDCLAFSMAETKVVSKVELWVIALVGSLELTLAEMMAGQLENELVAWWVEQRGFSKAENLVASMDEHSVVLTVA